MAQPLRLFAPRGAHPEQAQRPAGLFPPHLSPTRLPSALQKAFPVCLVEAAEETRLFSVQHLVLEQMKELPLRSDEAELCDKVLNRLVAQIAELAEQDARESLSDLWGTAATSMIANPDLTNSEREAVRKYISKVRDRITIDGPVLPFRATTPVLLLHRMAERARRSSISALKHEQELLVPTLKASLHADPPNAPSPARKDRLQATLQALEETLSAWQAPLNPTLFHAGDAAEAHAHADEQTSSLFMLFRAFRIARLETTNRYKESVHDAFFAHFSVLDLTDEEWALYPPIPVHLDTQSLTGADFEAVLSLLETPLPLKILVTIDRPYDDEASALLSGWRSCLAERALSGRAAFVMQGTAAQPDLMMAGFNEGLAYEGPALFCVYTGAGTAIPQLSPSEAAAAAHAARLFPSFVYAPGKGGTWATRFRLTGNPQQDAQWPQIEVPSTGDGAASTTLFTAADYLACDKRLAGHFVVVPAGRTPDTLMPLADYLAADRSGRIDRTPYLTLVDDAGKPQRVVCSPAVLLATETVAARWRNLQEEAGIQNSHAAAAVAVEQDRLQKVFEGEKKKLAQAHQEAMDRHAASLAEQVVSNIAAGLLNLKDGDFGLPQPAAAPPAKKPPAQQTPPPAVATPPPVEEEAELSFDEPYIDTPDCTSCDECINLNDKIFAYDADDKAYIKDPRGGPYADLVTAAEKCPAHIIHPGKPLNPKEPGLDELMKRAEPYV